MHRITKVGVLSLGKLMGVLGTIFGLIIGVVYGGIFALMGLATTGQGGQGGPPMILMALMFVVGMPIFYGVFSFIFGLVAGLIANLSFGILGPLEVEIKGLNLRLDDPI